MLDEMRQEHEQVKVDHIRIQQQLKETNSRVRDMEEKFNTAKSEVGL